MSFKSQISITQGGFTGYRLATDEEGEVFYQQVVSYMKKLWEVRGYSFFWIR